MDETLISKDEEKYYRCLAKHTRKYRKKRRTVLFLQEKKKNHLPSLARAHIVTWSRVQGHNSGQLSYVVTVEGLECKPISLPMNLNKMESHRKCLIIVLR